MQRCHAFGILQPLPSRHTAEPGTVRTTHTHLHMVRRHRTEGRTAGTLASLLLAALAWSQDAEVVFAVVTKVPKDRKAVTVQISAGGSSTETLLIATESVLDSPIWKKLEVCQSLRADARKVPEGYRVVGVTVLDASMLPMTLQGLAGDCLLKRALEFAPQID